MSESHSHAAHAAHPHVDYVKVWAILVVLLVVSVLGPMLEIQVITLITAFGIAVVKAYLVVKNFMHINIEPKFVTYTVVTGLAFMGLFFFFVAPDVMNHDGANWVNVAAKDAVEAGLAKAAASGSHH